MIDAALHFDLCPPSSNTYERPRELGLWGGATWRKLCSAWTLLRLMKFRHDIISADTAGAGTKETRTSIHIIGGDRGRLAFAFFGENQSRIQKTVQ